jgi:tRNA threonylcarbamoyladenosine biosynthesis protein TsaE
VREPGLRLEAATADEMRALGARLATALCGASLVEPFVLGLSGDLGAGKTTLVGGLLAALGHEGPARSPTYSLIEPYRLGGRDVYHCDLYRLRDPEELEDIGLRDLLAGPACCWSSGPSARGTGCVRPTSRCISRMRGTGVPFRSGPRVTRGNA